MHSAHGARPARRRGSASTPARVHVIPHGAFTHLTDVADPAPLPPELAAVERPVVLLFGLAAPLQGPRRAARGLARDRRRRAVGRRAAADGLARCARPRRRACASSSASCADAELAGVLRPRGPRRRCPTARSTSPASCSRRSAFGSRSLLTAVGGFPEVAATGAAELVPPGRPGRAARRARAAARRPGRARGARGGRGAAAAGAYCWDAVAERHLRLYATLVALRRATVALWAPRLLAYAQAGLPARPSPLLAPRARCAAPAAARGAGAPSCRTSSLIVAAHAEAASSRRRSPTRSRSTSPRDRLEVVVACDGSPDATPRAARGGRRRPRPRAAARRQGPRAGRRPSTPRRRRHRSPSPTRTRSGSPARCGALVARVRATRRRLRLRPASRFVNAGRARTRRACTGATRWRCARGVARWPRSPAATARSTPSRRAAYVEVDPVMGHDLVVPVHARQARLARGLRARRRARPRRWSRRSRASARASGG